MKIIANKKHQTGDTFTYSFSVIPAHNYQKNKTKSEDMSFNAKECSDCNLKTSLMKSAGPTDVAKAITEKCPDGYEMSGDSFEYGSGLGECVIKCPGGIRDGKDTCLSCDEQFKKYYKKYFERNSIPIHEEYNKTGQSCVGCGTPIYIMQPGRGCYNNCGSGYHWDVDQKGCEPSKNSCQMQYDDWKDTAAYTLPPQVDQFDFVGCRVREFLDQIKRDDQEKTEQAFKECKEAERVFGQPYFSIVFSIKRLSYSDLLKYCKNSGVDISQADPQLFKDVEKRTDWTYPQWNSVFGIHWRLEGKMEEFFGRDGRLTFVEFLKARYPEKF